jgi:hypothetical protein
MYKRSMALVESCALVVLTDLLISRFRAKLQFILFILISRIFFYNPSIEDTEKLTLTSFAPKKKTKSTFPSQGRSPHGSFC